VFILVRPTEYVTHDNLLIQMFQRRKQIFADTLNWDVAVCGNQERDCFDDDAQPLYLLCCDESKTTLHGSVRVMPTTGPTLLSEKFRETYPRDVDFRRPGIWEGTRMFAGLDVIKHGNPDEKSGGTFGRLLLALFEQAHAHGIHTIVANYERPMVKKYAKAGAFIRQFGSGRKYELGPGKKHKAGRPVYCGAFSISMKTIAQMRRTQGI
jgi:acyl homoserine lactone synthase